MEKEDAAARREREREKERKSTRKSGEPRTRDPPGIATHATIRRPARLALGCFFRSAASLSTSVLLSFSLGLFLPPCLCGGDIPSLSLISPITLSFSQFWSLSLSLSLLPLGERVICLSSAISLSLSTKYFLAGRILHSFHHFPTISSFRLRFLCGGFSS